MLLRSLLPYETDVSMGGLWMDPVLPETWGSMHAPNTPVGEARLTVDVSGASVTVKGLPEGMVFHRGARPSLAGPVQLGHLGLAE